MTELFVFQSLHAQTWFRALGGLEGALAGRDKERALERYSRLFRALAEAGFADVRTALADALLYGDSSLSAVALQGGDIPLGLERGAVRDLEALQELVRHDWMRETARLLDRDLPPLCDLAPRVVDTELHTLIRSLDHCEAADLFGMLSTRYRRHGSGELARFQAFRWLSEAKSFTGIAHPARPDAGRLVDVDRQLEMLRHNTETFLAEKPAQHTLLYGPRGSGKSTAVKSLLTDYAAAGLRLVELAPGALHDLTDVIERLRVRPHRYLLFVDDLSFEADSSDYGPLKTLLEGSLTARPANILVYATSNRRHLVKERFSERPDPLDEDVHGWDAQNDKLALSDRFGLTITFPDATQLRYLKIVHALAEGEGVLLPDLEQRAIRFADWGNGYSGRTAQQFVDSLRAEAS